MEMAETAAGTLMVQLFKRIKVEMNGAVTEAMEQRGIHYPLNYGVSIPTLKEIASSYGVNHKLAILLHKQEVREMQLCAFYLADPLKFMLAEADRWGDALTNTELCEQAVTSLFVRFPDADALALGWLASGEEMRSYAALLLVAKVVRRPQIIEAQAEQLLQAIEVLLNREPNSAAVAHGAVVALRETAAVAAPLKARVQTLLNRCAASDHPRLRYIATETAWQIS